MRTKSNRSSNDPALVEDLPSIANRYFAGYSITHISLETGRSTRSIKSDLRNQGFYLFEISNEYAKAAARALSIAYGLHQRFNLGVKRVQSEVLKSARIWYLGDGSHLLNGNLEEDLWDLKKKNRLSRDIRVFKFLVHIIGLFDIPDKYFYVRSGHRDFFDIPGILEIWKASLAGCFYYSQNLLDESIKELGERKGFSKILKLVLLRQFDPLSLIGDMQTTRDQDYLDLIREVEEEHSLIFAEGLVEQRLNCQIVMELSSSVEGYFRRMVEPDLIDGLIESLITLHKSRESTENERTSGIGCTGQEWWYTYTVDASGLHYKFPCDAVSRKLVSHLKKTYPFDGPLVEVIQKDRLTTCDQILGYFRNTWKSDELAFSAIENAVDCHTHPSLLHELESESLYIRHDFSEASGTHGITDGELDFGNTYDDLEPIYWEGAVSDMQDFAEEQAFRDTESPISEN